MALNGWDSAQLRLAAYLHASLCLVHFSDQAPAFFLCHIYFSGSPFMSLSCCFWMSLTRCVPFCLCFCVYFPLWASPLHLTVSLSLSLSLLWMACISHSAFSPVQLPFSLFLCLWVWFVCECVCLSFAPIYVCITEWLSRCVHFSLSVSLFSTPVGEEADKRSSRDTRPLSDPVCQWKDLRKLSSLLLPLDRATANIFHREMLIFIFLTFSNTSVDTEVLYLEYLFCDLNIFKPYFLKKKYMYESNFL